MKIITLKAWKRPDYLNQVLHGIKSCYELNRYQKLIISIDDSSRTNECLNVIQQSQIGQSIKTDCFVQKENLGCAGNSRFLFERAFNGSSASWMVHFEDDTLPAPDYLMWMNRMYDFLKRKEDGGNPLFASCPWRRKKLASWWPEWSTQSDIYKLPTEESLTDVFELPWFECGGGFGMTGGVWHDYIMQKGRMFGVDYISDIGRSEACHGEDWLNQINISDRLSWAWPFNKYFRPREMCCVFPNVSRVRNIGKEDGLHPVHLDSPTWYEDNLDNQNWTGNQALYNKQTILNSYNN